MKLERIMMGTTAIHQLGDISRTRFDYFAVDAEDDDNFYGEWLTGFGFVNVRFPKATSRQMTAEEAAWLAERRIVIA